MGPFKAFDSLCYMYVWLISWLGEGTSRPYEFFGRGVCTFVLPVGTLKPLCVIYTRPCSATILKTFQSGLETKNPYSRPKLPDFYTPALENDNLHHIHTVYIMGCSYHHNNNYLKGIGGKMLQVTILFEVENLHCSN